VTPAASDLGNISPGDELWYWLAFIAVICLLGTAAAVVTDGWRSWRGRPRLRDLMDDGDGQGDAKASTEAISMRAITAMERLIPACPEFCADLTSPGDGTDCTCPAPCGRDWCTRKREQHRSPVPVTWTEREEGVR
jgi:hypothetical protein